MATGRSNQLTKQVGEYLVAAELARLGLIAATFSGSVPDYDTIASDSDYRAVFVQVKTVTLGNKKGVDIVVAREAGDAVTVEVKGVARRYDWPADNIQSATPTRHYVALVSFEGRIEDATAGPRCWVVPFQDLKPYLPMPGMYGGFSYWLKGGGNSIKVIAESWCRVVDGSGQRHEITADGSKLVAKGFV